MSPRTRSALESVAFAADALCVAAEADGDREVEIASVALTAILLALREGRTREAESVKIVLDAVGW